MDNPHLVRIMGRMDLERRREAADLARLYLAIDPVRERSGRSWLRSIGAWMVRLGMRLERWGMTSARRSAKHIDLEAVTKASRQAA